MAKKITKKARKKVAPKPSAADAIRRLDAEFMKAANAKDSAALVKAFYSSNAVLLPPNCPIVEGGDNIRVFFQGIPNHNNICSRRK